MTGDRRKMTSKNSKGRYRKRRNIIMYAKEKEEEAGEGILP
jgi:hypothetical protein